jgi:hypothetical protein
MLAFGYEKEKLASLAEPEHLLANEKTYSVTRKQIFSVSHVSCSLIMFG